MSRGETTEGGRTDPSGVSFTHRLLNTHITALTTKGGILFIGEGQHCHAYDLSGRQVTSVQVFRAAVVHGLRIQSGPVDDNATWQVLVFGQKSLAVLLYLSSQESFYVLLSERSMEDWIVDAGLEKDLSHIIVATGHNSLLRCHIPNLVECCRELWEHTSDSTANRTVAKTRLHSIPDASPGTQEPKSVDMKNRVKEQICSGNLSKPVSKTPTYFNPEASPGTKEPGSLKLEKIVKEQTTDGHTSSSVLKSHCPIPATSSVTQEPESIDFVNRIKEDGRSGGLAVKEGGNGDGFAVVAQVTCVEKCVLFSGHLVMMSGCWEGAVMLAGTMALQVMVWGPWGPRDNDGSALPLHCLWGHQGSIFSITFNSSQGLIATTSDDRSLRLWEVVRHDTHTPSTILTTTLPATPEEERLYWTSAKITEKLTLYGHRARVWRSLILPSYLVSVGEDSIVCVWRHSGALVASWRAHEGASIWSVAASEGAKASLITGGADGSVRAWSLSGVVPVIAKPVNGLPSSVSLEHECVVLTGKCSQVTTGQAGTIPSLISEKGESYVPGSNELSRDTPQNPATLKKTEAAVNFSVLTTEQLDNELFLNSERGESSVPESHELFSSTVKDASQEKPSRTATDLLGSVSQMGQSNLSESCDFSSMHPKPLASNCKSSTSVTADFPRCLALIGNGMFVVVTNSGKVYSNSHEGSWFLEYEDKKLMNYSILEASPDRRRVALGTLTGAIVVFCQAEGRLIVEVEAEGPPGKVFALQWLTAGRILALGAAGVMTTWEIQDEGTVRAVSTHHLPVSMHRWLCAVYVQSADTLTTSTTTPSTPNLVCGDRAGSLHLYTQNDHKPHHTLRGIHGKNGVTSLLSWGDLGIVYSSGRDGCVRSLKVCDDRSEGGGRCPRLQPLTATRVYGASWVAQLLCVGRKLLAVCFHGVKLRLWDVDAELALLEVECGGAHRSWDLVLRGEKEGKIVCAGDNDNQVCSEECSLLCGFLKDGQLYTFSTSLTDKLLPIIKTPLNSQETMDMCILHQQGRETLFVTAGEDTTLRVHALKHLGHRRPLAVLRSHLSGVRALCLVEGLGGMLNKGANEGREQMADDTEDNGKNSIGKNVTKNEDSMNQRRQMTGGTKDSDTQDCSDSEWKAQVTSGNRKDYDTIWMVSAGGRAEFKVWQCKVSMIANTSKNPTRVISTHRPGNMSGIKDDQELSVTCQEMGSHMLRTGSHKTWRNQQLTFDPETRYMAAAAHWITSSLALVALASSDGFLRIFSFQPGGEKLEVTEVEEMQLREVCAVECGCCLLGVARLRMLTQTILVTYSTRGSVMFWDLQAVVKWLIQGTALQDHTHGPPQPRHVKTVAAHQSGVNSIAFHHHPDNPTYITMVTGGDDNKISIWDVVVEEKLDCVQMTVTLQLNVFGHASQVSGLAWLSGDHLISASIDQRLIIWKYERSETMLQKSTQNTVCHLEPRELNDVPQKEDRTIHRDFAEVRNTHVETIELNKMRRHEDRTTQNEPSENRATRIELEPHKATREESRSTQREPSQPSQMTRPDVNTANDQILVPLGSCYTGVPDVKGIIVTDVDDGKKSGDKSQVIEKRVLVYGMGLQVFDVTVDGNIR